MDLLTLYRSMARARAYETAVADLWNKGLISGEMHLATGEEGIASGVMAHLDVDDALALDHRGTPWLLERGVDPVAMLREMLGREDGLCGGRGGHMHLLAPDHRAATSGIVGAAGPLAAGFALAATRLRPGGLAVATFGDGALNQGMLMEAMNLAAAWRLPVLFVCKDNGWAITSRSASLTGGDPLSRAEGLGVPGVRVDGLDALAVWRAVGELVRDLRAGRGPRMLHATCSRLYGHFLGDLLVRTAMRPTTAGRPVLARALGAAVAGEGGGAAARVGGLLGMTGVLARLRVELAQGGNCPLARARRTLARDAVDAADREAAEAASADVAAALGEGTP